MNTDTIRRVLIVAATGDECSPVLQMAGCSMATPWLHAGVLHGQPVDVLVSGVGAVCMAFRLTQTLMLQQHQYGMVISVGIAGSYAEDIPLGTTVQIVEDCMGDVGIDDRGAFCTLRDAGLPDDAGAGGWMMNPAPLVLPCRMVRGVTVQTVSGSAVRIAELRRRFCAQVETMENAAFFYVCRALGAPFASLRGISNRVEPRNRGSWRVADAIEDVNAVAAAVICRLGGTCV